MSFRARMPPHAALMWLSFVLVAASANAVPLTVSLDTTGLGGSAVLEFDLADGDGSVNSTVAVFGFSPIAILGGADAEGDVSGSLPGTVTIGDADIFNTFDQEVSLGGVITFALDLNLATPSSGQTDVFRIFLLDDFFVNGGIGIPLFETSDPLDAIFVSGALGNRAPAPDVGQGTAPVLSFETRSVAVPEPNILGLVSIGVLLGFFRRRRRLVSAFEGGNCDRLNL